MKIQLLLALILLWAFSSCQRGVSPETFFQSVQEKLKSGDSEVFWDSLSPIAQRDLEEIGMNLINETSEGKREKSKISSKEAKKFVIDELTREGEPRTIITGEVTESDPTQNGVLIKVKYTKRNGEKRNAIIELSKINDKWFFESGAWLDEAIYSRWKNVELPFPTDREFSESMLPPIIVNLESTESLLKTSVAVMYDPTLLEFHSHENLIRDILIEVLSSKKASQIRSIEQKEVLKQELKDKLNQRVSKGRDVILHISFPEFIIEER